MQYILKTQSFISFLKALNSNINLKKKKKKIAKKYVFQNALNDPLWAKFDP
jgi:hypothetical protein